MTITEFLLARIAEHEEAARAASHAGPRWTKPTVHGPIVAIDNDTEWGGDPVVYDEGSPSEDQAAHIALNDPAHVLAECKAKRRIVEEHEPNGVTTFGSTWEECSICYDDDSSSAGQEYFETWPCPTMRALASVYAEHPDYDEAWRA